MQKLSRVKIGSKTYPIKVDLNVLAEIQEQYGSVNQFERDLLGLKLAKDENGAQLYTSDGDPQMYIVEPSIKAIRTALPLMINEGLEVEARAKGKEFEPLEDIDIITECNISFEALSQMIHAEYKKCFEVKKL